MSQVLEKPEVAAGDDVLCRPPVRPMTREEFERAGELGIFRPEERLELIGGEVIAKVTPQRTPHATAVSLAAEALGRAFPSGHHVRVQLPLALGPHNEPEPDLAVVIGSARDYKVQHPATAVLVVEVADTTLRLDRGKKASLYARAGIGDYWLVNLQDGVLEVHREPAAMEDQPFGHHYRNVARHSPPAGVTPLAALGVTIAVTDLLP